MKKNLGFFLAETLIVTTVVAFVMTILYTQVTSIFTNYNNRVERYNNINGIYAAHEISKYLQTTDQTSPVSLLSTAKLGAPAKYYVDITSSYTGDFYTKLKDSLNVSIVYFTDFDLTNLISNNLADFTLPVRTFIRLQKPAPGTFTNEYRLVVVFNNDTYATIKHLP